MKKIIFAAVALLAVVSCSQKPSFKIEGTIEGASGKAVLSFKNPVSKTEVNDTVAIENGKFVFGGYAEDVVPAKIEILAENDEPATAHMYIENAPISVKLDWSNVKRSKRRGNIIAGAVIAGGANNEFKAAFEAIPENILAQEKYAAYRAGRAEVAKAGDDMNKYMELYGKFMSEFKDVSDSLAKETADAKMAFIKSNPDVECAADEFSKIALGKSTLAELEEVFNVFTPRVQNSAMARKIKNEIDVLNAIKPGNVVPDFTLKNLAGEDFTFSSLKGKYVIIDFWASWCGPCRASIPGVKELYAKYKDKGLEIVGVSCDRKENDWRKASEEEQLPWINLIDIQNANRVATKYAVHYIPTMYLIDQEGKMIGKMGHHELDVKLKELLGE